MKMFLGGGVVYIGRVLRLRAIALEKRDILQKDELTQMICCLSNGPIAPNHGRKGVLHNGHTKGIEKRENELEQFFKLYIEEQEKYEYLKEQIEYVTKRMRYYNEKVSALAVQISILRGEER